MGTESTEIKSEFSSETRDQVRDQVRNEITTTEQLSGAAKPYQDPSPVCDHWQQMMQAVLGFVMLVGALALVHYYGPRAAESAPPDDQSEVLQKQIHELTSEVEQLKRQEAMPAVVLNRYRNSIGYIYGVYQVGFPNQRPEVRARVSGTGFLVGNGLLATNRHVAEPWYGDSEAETLMH